MVGADGGQFSKFESSARCACVKSQASSPDGSHREEPRSLHLKKKNEIPATSIESHLLWRTDLTQLKGQEAQYAQKGSQQDCLRVMRVVRLFVRTVIW